SRVFLQIVDRFNGAIAEYLLPLRTVTITKLGGGDKLNATVRKIDGEWLQLTLTSTLAAGTGDVIVQLADNFGTRTFKPNGEAVTIRAVKLERGETATPYS